MSRFCETKVAKESFYGAKKPINDVNVDNIIISKLVETKTNSKYWIGYLDEVTRPLVLVLPKMGGHVKAFSVKDRDKDKNNKLISFRIDEEKLLEKCRIILTKIKDQDEDKNNKLTYFHVDDEKLLEKYKMHLQLHVAGFQI